MMLKEMDIRWLPNGKRNIFSVKFIEYGTGKLRYFHRVYACGLRWNMRLNNLRAVQPCNANGDAIDHVHPVRIDLFIMYNNLEVIL